LTQTRLFLRRNQANGQKKEREGNSETQANCKESPVPEAIIIDVPCGVARGKGNRVEGK